MLFQKGISQGPLPAVYDSAVPFTLFLPSLSHSLAPLTPPSLLPLAPGGKAVQVSNPLNDEAHADKVCRGVREPAAPLDRDTGGYSPDPLLQSRGLSGEGQGLCGIFEQWYKSMFAAYVLVSFLLVRSATTP